MNDPRLKQDPTGGGFTASPFFVPSAEAAELPHFTQARPLASPPRPACRPVRGLPPLCPSKPATARRGASLALFATAAAPPRRLDGPPRPAEAARGVIARPPPPKPATARQARPPPAVRLPLAVRRPPWRGDHRPPPPPAVRVAAVLRLVKRSLKPNPYLFTSSLKKYSEHPGFKRMFHIGVGRTRAKKNPLIGKKVSGAVNLRIFA